MSLWGKLFRHPIKAFVMDITLYRWDAPRAESVTITYECTDINDAIESAAYILGLDEFGIGHTEKRDGCYKVVLFERKTIVKKVL